MTGAPTPRRSAPAVVVRSASRSGAATPASRRAPAPSRIVMALTIVTTAIACYDLVLLAANL